MSKFIHFIKYNNAAMIILVLFLILGTSAFASETGREFIGEKKTSIEGVDNTLLLSVDLEQFSMDFKIEKVEADENFYYVTYTYLDIALVDKVWQYQMKEGSLKVSLKIKDDLGVYLAKELKEVQEKRVGALKEAKLKAQESGAEKRIEVIEYSGLLGKAFDAAEKIFPGYEPVKKLELPSPESLPELATPLPLDIPDTETTSASDNLTDIYNDYVDENDPDKDNIFGAGDNCPDIANPDQLDSDQDGSGDACDNLESANAIVPDNNQNSTLTPLPVPDNATNKEEEIDEKSAVINPEGEVNVVELPNSTSSVESSNPQ